MKLLRMLFVLSAILGMPLLAWPELLHSMLDPLIFDQIPQQLMAQVERFQKPESASCGGKSTGAKVCQNHFM